MLRFKFVKNATEHYVKNWKKRKEKKKIAYHDSLLWLHPAIISSSLIEGGSNFRANSALSQADIYTEAGFTYLILV